VNVTEVLDYIPNFYSRQFWYTTDAVHYGAIAKYHHFGVKVTVSMLITQLLLNQICQ
jgi:hypothetical protein